MEKMPCSPFIMRSEFLELKNRKREVAGHILCEQQRF